MMFFGLFWLIAFLFLVRWAVRADPGRLPSGEVQRLEGEVLRLREEVERLGGQVERLLDEQSFLLRLLESGERPRALGGAPDAAEPTPGPPGGARDNDG